MILRCLTTLGVAGALAVAPLSEARADAGDFIGGAIIGGVLGHAITKDQQRKRTTRTTTTTRRVYRPGIPSTAQGAQTQTALNYFGYNAGRVDGQIGPGSRQAIQSFQASMGYPVNGYDLQPYQFDFLMQAYYWAQNGGQAQTQLGGQPLLMAYRQKVQTGTLYASTPPATALAPAPATTAVVAPPAVVTPAPAPEPVEAALEEEADSPNALPNFFSGGGSQASLANRCNGIMLQTSSNGGYTTLASMGDPDFALSEQFCLGRSYAIARGEELMGQIQGLTPTQIASQCDAYGVALQPHVDAISVSSPAEAEAEMRGFALGAGVPPADLAATARVCLSVGYSQDNMPVALGSALLLSTLGEPAYGELLGHHLREGFGTTKRNDLAMQWYQASLSAIENGAEPVILPAQSDRPMLLREATVRLQSGEAQGSLPGAVQGTTAASLPTFNVAQ